MATGSLPIGSAAWVSEERAAALRLADNDVHEFSFAARRGFEWLNDHMAGIFNENEINFAETFKTPGRARQQNNWAARKPDNGEARVPLSDIFSGTPRGAPNPFLQQLNRLNSPTTTNNELRNPPAPADQFSPKKAAPPPTRQAAPISFADSGYHGSQSQDTMVFSSPEETRNRLQSPSPARHAPFLNATPTAHTRQSPTRTRILQSPTGTFLTAKEEQTAKVIREASQRLTSPQLARTQNLSARLDAPSSPVRTLRSSPFRTSPIKSTPAKASSPLKPQPQSSTVREPVPNQLAPEPEQEQEQEPEPEPEPQIPNSNDDDEGTHSDGSSPIRPVVRKSSLNFASLPAREPLNTGKSLGGRMSRTSNLDLKRTSYYGRPTGGKSLGNTAVPPSDDDDVDMDDDTVALKPAEAENVTAHNKTYTQRLQDQISMLGKSQPKAARPSKSMANLAPAQTTTPAPTRTVEVPKASSPVRKPTTPGAFPEEDEDDDWIQPQPTAQKPKVASPRPAVPPKDDTVSTGTLNMDFVLPKQRQQTSRPTSPQRRPVIPERTTSALSHVKSASVSALPDPKLDDTAALKKTISVSNPTLTSVPESGRPQSPLRSPTRSVRDSPLKHVKNKLSSILKSSKGLLASSAAISAEGKSSILSPSTTRLGLQGGLSSDSLAQPPAATETSYPDLTRALMDAQAMSRPASPSKPSVRKTRASAERERKEKQMEKEAQKEAQRLADQNNKLEKVREKEAEKARVFSKEQERIAAMEKQVSAQREQEKKRPVLKEAPKSARSSPRRKPQAQDPGDVEMQEAPAVMAPPPSITRPGSALRGKEVKRPVRPTKDAASRSRVAPPTVIKVNMGPHHSQHHPSNAALSANLGEALGSSGTQSQGSGKAGHPTLKSKGSAQSLKSSVSSTGRPKALELAAKRKEQEEREAQRKRDAKAEMERKRAVLQEEERRQEQQRRLEAERQREKEREAAEAKKRQAAIERAKQTRAPPPAVRSQPNGPPDYASFSQEKAGTQPSRPGSRMGSAIGTLKGQKRPLGQDNDVGNARTQTAARNGPTYQGKDAKRRRTSQEPDDDKEMESLPIIKGPPVRPSAGFKKEMTTKQMYASGYAAAPQGTTRDLFKSAVTSQHNSAMKTGHGLDTAQFSKGTIPFAATAGQAGAPFKTPARPGAAAGPKSTVKSAPRTSPRFQNGDSIDLPEIQTDDDDEDSDDEGGGGSGGGAAVASWADSPDLRRALLRQETMDPSQIFGPPAPLNMEEVFSKSKDRWHKFRARTSSANWSGGDRLTDEDIRRDLLARDKLRKEGAWTYELSKDLA